jgi:hypothetical protein
MPGVSTIVITVGEAMPFRHLVALLYAKGIGAAPVAGPATTTRRGDLVVTAARGGGPVPWTLTGYPPPNFLNSSDSASVRPPSTATFALWTCAGCCRRSRAGQGGDIPGAMKLEIAAATRRMILNRPGSWPCWARSGRFRPGDLADPGS